MNQRIACFIASVTVLIISTTAQAQHDPQRNATWDVAAGKYEAALKTLDKAEADEAETHFLQLLIALQQGKLEAGVSHAKAALDAGMPFERLVAGPREILAPLYKTDAYQTWKQKAGNPQLIHGPMLGNVTSNSASFWVRTAKASNVQIRVARDIADNIKLSEIELKTEAGIVTQATKTSADTDFATVLKVTGLKPGTRYRYQIVIDKQAQRTKNSIFTTSPKEHTASKFRIAFGGGAGYIPEWEYMWNTIGKEKPHAMLMLGDNVYIDAPEQSLTSRYCYYRRQSRPEWQRFTASTAMFSIYDDHDFGKNDCVPGPEIETPSWKRKVWNEFKNNWANPAYGGGEKQPGCWYDFYIGDVHFIMLDGRYYRNKKGDNPSMLGPVQKKWLFDTLKNSKGTFKVLASPVPFTEKIKPGSKDPWDGYPAEREEIFSFIETENINGLFLICADRHRSDLRITKRENGYDLYEFESSRLTNRHTHAVVKTPGLVWGYNKTCSFGLMTFDTKADDPQVKFEVLTIDGERMHEHVLKLSELQK
ncbi:MAG: alkaline phosphatase [Blastopirellula sp.]|nr:MAG: alkaline phosphatase [Blastopirellula sp.]